MNHVSTWRINAPREPCVQTTWGMGLLGVSNSKKTSMAAGGGEKGWTEMRLEVEPGSISYRAF